ncbi:MAG TPA: hypothetical protein VGO47_10040 [Chlamydiales bacterium]|nr:hypothetical protein [Chlamydiales bacterium]
MLRWILSCDQPFDEVEKPQFHVMVLYATCRWPLFKIPSATTVKRHAMAMGREMEEHMKIWVQVSTLSSAVDMTCLPYLW